MVRMGRILVVGSPGAGKSTLARLLANATDLPLHHLDDEYWGPDWSRPDHETWVSRQHAITSSPRWIIDGNHLSTMDIRARRAELVILVDTAPLHCLTRIVQRAAMIRRGRHEGLPASVRAQADGGQKVRATKDFLPLLTLVAFFRLRTWWPVIEQARSNPEAGLIVAVGPGQTRLRSAVVRRRLRRAGVPALVVPLFRAHELIATERNG